MGLYKHVIDDVIHNMREEYLNESVDTGLLEELKKVGVAIVYRSVTINSSNQTALHIPGQFQTAFWCAG